MQYFGRLLCSTLAILSGLNIFGIFISFIIGYIIDSYINFSLINDFSINENRIINKLIFFKIMFQVMGYLTKSKGIVTKHDINNANIVMHNMRLNKKLQKYAKESFREGKNINFNLKNQLCVFYKYFYNNPYAIKTFINIQIQTAFVNGFLHNKARNILFIIAEELRVDKFYFEHQLNILENAMNFNSYRNFNKYGKYQHKNTSNYSELQDPYDILGVSIKDSNLIIKNAYRKLMRKYHPDKLVSKNLSPKLMEQAKQKTQKIQKAYDSIKKQRGFR
ncbi:MAG: co-chaperone DjlA [Enterobacterales bacterium]